MGYIHNLLNVKEDDPITCQTINRLYYDHIKKSKYSKIIAPLELEQYLENYLWPLYEDDQASNSAHIMSIVLMVNQKFREKVNAWQTFKSSPHHFATFIKNVCKLSLSTFKTLNMREQTSLLIFLIHCFNSVETDLIRETIKKYASFPIWVCLSDARRETEFKKSPKLRKYWNLLKKKDAQLDEASLEEINFERRFLFLMIKQFIEFLSSIPNSEECTELDQGQQATVHYCERFLEFLTDLEALLPTRRFFNALLSDTQVVIICRKSNLCQRKKEGHLFAQLLETLSFYERFEIDDITGEALTNQEMIKKHYDRLTRLQSLAFKHFPDLKELYLSNIASIDKRESLIRIFDQLSNENLQEFMKILQIESYHAQTFNRELTLEALAYSFERVASQLDSLNEMPLYPTESIIWDENLVPNQYFDNDSCLALPKLNLQFLTLHDYLLRNFKLFRLESTYEIRQEIESSVSRMKPWKREDDTTMFGGWARMAIPIDDFLIVEVAKPNVGERVLSRVRAEIKVVLDTRKEVKKEWEGLRKHDVCFLITVDPPNPPGTAYKYKEPFLPQVGLKYVRGCEIEGMLDPEGKLIDESSQERPQFDTDVRTYRVWLDPNQYYLDTIEMDEHYSIYDTFNILMRRKPKENNFKAVLETIRDLMNTKCVVPDWLHDVILGYGNPAAAHYLNMPNISKSLDFNDTFLDFDHLQESFPDYEFQLEVEKEKLVPSYILEINEKDKTIVPTSYTPLNRGPYPYTQPKRNSIRFTPTQVEAIKSGMQPGLTIVVGPPGTGKTDVAVQIISNIYHKFPDQRTLVVTHSNQALNQLFEKIMCLDVDERHLLRLGHGEEELETEKDFSRYGRVNFVLKKRSELLDEVNRLAESLNIKSDFGHTCETAGYFYLYHVLARWEDFMDQLKNCDKIAEDVANLFPFSRFFLNAPQPLFKKQSFQEDLKIAKGCYRFIKKIFTQLDEFKAFEMLRTGLDRSHYLLTREAKIIAMTCTHAALKRRELVEIGFQYDNILMEEAAQILEIETFIPLLLQNPEHGHNRLKRWIMIGDHHQLPPVIKNMAFQKFSNMEQSLFTRLVRLGVPTVELDCQGRSRPSLCSLFRWQYNHLGDLPHVLDMTKSRPYNPGFFYDYQIINVEDFNGIGESEPVPFFYQVRVNIIDNFFQVLI